MSSYEECSANESDQKDPEYQPYFVRKKKTGKKQCRDPYPGIEKKIEILRFWHNGNNSRQSFHQVQRRYPGLKTESTLHKWMKRFREKDCFRADKSKAIDEYILKKYNEARSHRITVYTNHIRDWALEKNQQMKLDGFTASEGFVRQWKYKHNIDLPRKPRVDRGRKRTDLH